MNLFLKNFTLKFKSFILSIGLQTKDFLSEIRKRTIISKPDDAVQKDGY